MLKNRRMMTLALCLFATSATYAQGHFLADSTRTEIASARAAVVHLIKVNNAGQLLGKEGLSLVSGEAKSWKVASLGNLNSPPDKLLTIGPDKVVARVQWLDKNQHTTDYYFYLNRDSKNRWLVESCRSLSSAGIVEEAHKKLIAKTNRSEDENYQERNTALVLLSDAQLHKWFADNKSKLTELSAAARALPRPYPAEIKADNKTYPAIAKMIEELSIDSVALHETGDIQAIIGGVNRDFVGLLNAPGGQKPPISADKWIWIEDLGGNWFLFKHT